MLASCLGDPITRRLALKRFVLRSYTCRAQETRVRKIAKSSALAVLFFASVSALAQQAPDAGQLLQQSREPLRLPPPSEPVLPKPPEPKPALPGAPELRVTVKEFTFTGNTVYGDAQLRAVTNEFLNKSIKMTK